MRLTLALPIVVAVAWPAGARGGGDDPDLEIAQRRFLRGGEFHAAKHYRQAIDEFEAAGRVTPSPEIDFNIARCHDRLEEFRPGGGGLRALPRGDARRAGGVAPVLAVLLPRRPNDGHAQRWRLPRLVSVRVLGAV